MLLNLLKRLEVSRITIAGFDGFDEEKHSNYADESFQNDRHVEEFERLNKEIGKMFSDIVKTLNGKCEFKMITPSRFNDVLTRDFYI